MGRVSGTPKKVTLDGITFTVKMDSDITLNTSPYENEMIATSGDSMLKKTVRSPDHEGITLEVDPAEQEQLNTLSKRVDKFPMSVQLADESVYSATGAINFESTTSADNTATIKMMPDNALRGWTLFAA